MLVYFSKFKFLIGDYKSVIKEILPSFVEKKSQIILPCSLNDLALAENKSDYQSIDFCVADSMFLTWWFAYKYRPAKVARVYGPDLFISILKYLDKKKLKASFLIADKAFSKTFKNKIGNEYKNLSGQFYILGRSTAKEKAILDEIVSSKPKVIFIGVGSPKQVTVAAYLKKNLGNCKIFCVGAAFDFFSGQKQQAPTWIRKSGLEWFFRLMTEPKRLWRRYLVDVPSYFLSLLARKFFGKTNL